MRTCGLVSALLEVPRKNGVKSGGVTKHKLKRNNKSRHPAVFGYFGFDTENIQSKIAANSFVPVLSVSDEEPSARGKFEIEIFIVSFGTRVEKNLDAAVGPRFFVYSVITGENVFFVAFKAESEPRFAENSPDGSFGIYGVGRKIKAVYFRFGKFFPFVFGFGKPGNLFKNIFFPIFL